MIVIAVDSIESFTEYLKEINNTDYKRFRKIGKESSDYEIAEMLLTGKLKTDDIVYLGLGMKRTDILMDILYANNFDFG